MGGKYTAKHFSGHLVLSGMLCLFVAMACGLGAVALIGEPAGSTFMTLTKIFGFLWLPILGVGALIRATGADNQIPEPNSAASRGADDSMANGS